RVASSGASFAKLAALSSQPCNASRGGATASPQTCPRRVRWASATVISVGTRTQLTCMLAGVETALARGRGVVFDGEFVPAPGVLQDQRSEAFDLPAAVVQRGDVAQRFTARGDEEVAVLHGDLLQRLQAVHREPGAGDVQFSHAFGCQPAHRSVGVRLQPWLAPDPRLEADRNVRLTQAQPFAQQSRRSLALAEVRIARMQVAFEIG